MINKISMENFKGFKKLEDLHLKPITILCGTNSCGKSSILQSILLFKQTLDSKNTNQTLLLNGRYVHLGSFNNIIHKKNLEKNVDFEFTFKIPNKIIMGKLSALTRNLMASINELTGEHTFHFKVSLNSPLNSLEFIKPITVNKFEFGIKLAKNNDEFIDGPSFEMILLENKTYNIKWKNINPHSIFDANKEKKYINGEIIGNVEFANLCPKNIDFDFSKHEKDYKVRIAVHSIYSISDFLRSFFETYSYIGPLREEPSRRYIYENEILEIGTKGENAAYIYLVEKEKLYLKNQYICKNDNFEIDKKFMTLSDTVDYWMDFMGIKGLTPEAVNETIYLSLQASETDKTIVSIADVGFGVSQAFPMILEGLRMPERNTLILEQPEIHLHPKLQMKMADYFIALALSNKNVIVETHSDHMINRLVRRIVEDPTGNLKNLIGIYFIKPSENGSVFEEIKIDDMKGIINWPVDFFDQTASEQEKILQAGLKKRRKARNEGEPNL